MGERSFRFSRDEVLLTRLLSNWNSFPRLRLFISGSTHEGLIRLFIGEPRVLLGDRAFRCPQSPKIMVVQNFPLDQVLAVRSTLAPRTLGGFPSSALAMGG